MSKKKKTQIEIYNSIRKPMPPPSRRHKDKKKYNRKDQTNFEE